MARDLDDFPVYDAIIKPGTNQLSDIWRDVLASFIESLQEYLSERGIFVPRLTTAERDLIQSPVNGQLIYNTSLNKFQGRENGSWQNLI